MYFDAYKYICMHWALSKCFKMSHCFVTAYVDPTAYEWCPLQKKTTEMLATDAQVGGEIKYLHSFCYFSLNV